MLGSLFRVPRRRDLTWLSLGLVAGVLGQIVLGGITVLVDLHPLAVQGHMLLSLVLVGTAVVLLRRAGEPDDAVRGVLVSARHATPAVAVGAGDGGGHRRRHDRHRRRARTPATRTSSASTSTSRRRPGSTGPP